MTATLPHRPSDDPGDPSAAVGQSSLEPVARLNRLATALAERPLGPRADFRVDLRARLLDEAVRGGLLGPDRVDAPALVPEVQEQLPARGPETVAGDSASARPRRRLPRGRRAAAVGLAVVLTGGGVAAAAAAHSLPGDPLYPAKRAGQSAELALDPSSGAGPALRLVSARISDVERTLTLDPHGRDGWRWRAVDGAVGDASRALDGVAATSSNDQLGAALTESRTRLERLVVAVPAAARPSVQELLDTVDALLPSTPVLGSSGLLSPLLPPLQSLSPSDALAAGWPLELPGTSTAPAVSVVPESVVPLPTVGAVDVAPRSVGQGRSGRSGILSPTVGTERASGSTSAPASAFGTTSASGPTSASPSVPSGSTGAAGSSTGTRTSTGLGRVLRPTAGGTGTRAGARPSSGISVGDTVERAVDDSLSTASGLVRGLPQDRSAATH